MLRKRFQFIAFSFCIMLVFGICLQAQTDITDLTGKISEQWMTLGGEGLTKIVDNKTNTKYLTLHLTTWVQWQADAEAVVDTYTITSGNDDPTRDPKDWELLGSNDGTNWTTLDTQTEQTFAARGQKNEYTFTNATAYTYYRLNITAINGNTSMMQFAEWELIGTSDGVAGIVAPTVNIVPMSTEVINVVWYANSTCDDYYTIERSMDGLTWDVLDTASANAQSYADSSLTQAVTYYYKVAASDTSVATAYGKVYSDVVTSTTLPGTGDLDDATDAGGTIVGQYPASDSPGAEGIENLIDNDVFSKFLTFHSTAWVQFHCDVPSCVTTYTLTSANDAPHRDPKDWTLKGSNDGMTWTTLDSVTGEYFLQRFQTKQYTIANDKQFTYYKLDVTALNANSTIIQIAELGLYGTLGVTPEYDGTTSLAFDGDDDYIAFDPNPSIHKFYDMTIEAWVNIPENTRDQKVIGEWTDWNNFFLLGINEYGKADFEYHNGGGAKNARVTVGNIETNKWTHVAVVVDHPEVDSSRISIYINGTLVGADGASTSDTLDVESETQPLIIGADPWDYPSAGLTYIGKIDEVRIWNVARTDEEIQTSMNSFDLDPATAGLTAYLPFEEGAGQTAADLTANANVATLGSTADVDDNDPAWIGPETPIAPEYTGNNSLVFDGTNDYIHFAADPSISQFYDMTIEAWVNIPENTRDQKVIGEWKDWDNFFLLGINESGKADFEYHNGGGAKNARVTVGLINTDEWTHVAVVVDHPEVDSTRIRIYINGGLAGEGGASTGDTLDVASETQPLIIGADPWDYPSAGLTYIGKVDEVRIWNLAKSQADIQTSMNNFALDPASTGLVAYLPCEEGEGQTTADQTAYGNDGLLGSTDGVDDNDPSWSIITGVEKMLLPTKMALEQNYPNPFNPTTTINYQLSANSFVTMKVFNLLGEEVVTLVNEKQNAGFYKTMFNTDGLVSGIYICRISVRSLSNGKTFTDSKKMMLLR